MACKMACNNGLQIFKGSFGLVLAVGEFSAYIEASKPEDHSRQKDVQW